MEAGHDVGNIISLHECSTKMYSDVWHACWSSGIYTKSVLPLWIRFLKNKVDIKLKGFCIDKSHRVKSTATARNRRKPIIVRFVAHNDKPWVYYKKTKKLRIHNHRIFHMSETSIHIKLNEKYLAKDISLLVLRWESVLKIKTDSCFKYIIQILYSVMSTTQHNQFINVA